MKHWSPSTARCGVCARRGQVWNVEVVTVDGHGRVCTSYLLCMNCDRN